MQPQFSMPLKKSASFWGLSITLILIFVLTLSLSGSGASSLMMITLGMAFLPIVGAMVLLGIFFLIFGIAFTAYLTRRLGGIILNKTQINKPILYTALVLGIFIALGFVLALVVNVPKYIV